jgi:hypothetical protein
MCENMIKFRGCYRKFRLYAKGVALRWIQVGSNCPLEFTTPLS